MFFTVARRRTLSKTCNCRASREGKYENYPKILEGSGVYGVLIYGIINELVPFFEEIHMPAPVQGIKAVGWMCCVFRQDVGIPL